MTIARSCATSLGRTAGRAGLARAPRGTSLARIGLRATLLFLHCLLDVRRPQPSSYTQPQEQKLPLPSSSTPTAADVSWSRSALSIHSVATRGLPPCRRCSGEHHQVVAPLPSISPFRYLLSGSCFSLSLSVFSTGHGAPMPRSFVLAPPGPDPAISDASSPDPAVLVPLPHRTAKSLLLRLRQVAAVAPSLPPTTDVALLPVQ